MAVESGCLSMYMVVVLSLMLNRSYGLQYTVGDTAWTVPPTNDFYVNWSSSHSFYVGDSLVFEFQTGVHDVMLVSESAYQNCSSDNPYRAFVHRPAMVPLICKGVFHFIRSASDYCRQGQKLYIVVQEGSPVPPIPDVPPASSPSIAYSDASSESYVPWGDAEDAIALAPTYSSQTSQHTSILKLIVIIESFLVWLILLLLLLLILLKHYILTHS